jgi:hypothetical protein
MPEERGERSIAVYEVCRHEKKVFGGILAR